MLGRMFQRACARVPQAFRSRAVVPVAGAVSAAVFLSAQPVLLQSEENRHESVAERIEKGKSQTIHTGENSSINAESNVLDPEQEPQEAYDEKTGQINWDCPCLGGMADGPCGPEFKEAFSCFVFSEADPKGMDCIEKFKIMQDCFRRHPEAYADEIEADERAIADAKREQAEKLAENEEANLKKEDKDQ